MCKCINYLSVNEILQFQKALNPNNVLKTTGEAKLAGSSSSRSSGSRRQQQTAAVAEKATVAAAAV